jgi:surface protein
VDLMGCSIYSSEDWNYILNKLNDKAGITVNSSVDDTGAESLGGNWILESNNSNLIGRYFTEGIKDYKHVLGSSAREMKDAGYTTTELQNAGYSISDISDAGYPSFIFNIANSDWNNSTSFPVKNTGNSFNGLIHGTVLNGNVVTVYSCWMSYTNDNMYDGLSFNTAIVSYGNSESINIKQFGGVALPNMDMNQNNGSFIGFKGTITATDAPDLVNPSLSKCFSNSTISNFGNINSWDVSAVTDMSRMFESSNFNGNISSWNTSNVTAMNNMFDGATLFNQPIGSWDTSKVTSMNGMFSMASLFNQPIASWNISNVVDIDVMFYRASSFNQPIGSWNISKVTAINNTFEYATSFNQSIGSWDTSNVVTMINTFHNATAFNQNIGTWNTSNVYRMDLMFDGASAFNQNISVWNTSNVGYMNNMFSGAISFNQNISSWNTSNVMNMNNMLNGASAFNYPGIGNWNFSKMSTLNNANMNNFVMNTGLGLYECTLLLENMSNNSTFTNTRLYDLMNIPPYSGSNSFAMQNILAIVDSKNIKFISNPLSTTVLNSKIYSATTLNNSLYTASELREAGYLYSEVSTAGYSSSELSNAGYSSSELKQAGYTVIQLFEAGYSKEQFALDGIFFNNIVNYCEGGECDNC